MDYYLPVGMVNSWSTIWSARYNSKSLFRFSTILSRVYTSVSPGSLLSSLASSIESSYSFLPNMLSVSDASMYACRA